MAKGPEWIRESNLIEDVDDPLEDARSFRAWKWFVAQPISLETILKLHRRIMFKKLPPEEKGHWRTCQAWVGGHEGYPWNSLPSAMKAWLHNSFVLNPHGPMDEWCRSAHVDFERIHPFIDGNGRTGRMILNYHRVKNGLEPLCIKASERWRYYEWFEEEDLETMLQRFMVGKKPKESPCP
jgi:Fic family protein